MNRPKPPDDIETAKDSLEWAIELRNDYLGDGKLERALAVGQLINWLRYFIELEEYLMHKRIE